MRSILTRITDLHVITQYMIASNTHDYAKGIADNKKKIKALEQLVASHSRA